LPYPQAPLGFPRRARALTTLDSIRQNRHLSESEIIALRRQNARQAILTLFDLRPEVLSDICSVSVVCAPRPNQPRV
jgi:hypothetical protein